MHGDNVIQSTVEVLVDTPIVFYQTKETSLHVSCLGAMQHARPRHATVGSMKVVSKCELCC